MRYEEIYRPLDQLSTLSKKQKEGSSLHPFARGYLLAASLMEQIRQDLRTGYSVTWGQVMRDDGEKASLSPEMDSIIYKETPYYEWKAARFAIVPKENVVAAIECKSQIPQNYSEHEKDVQGLQPFADKVYLFAEAWYGTPDNYDEGRKKIKTFGYQDVFVLKTYTGSSEHISREDEFARFIQTVRSL
jgi:hypothetical protein